MPKFFSIGEPVLVYVEDLNAGKFKENHRLNADRSSVKLLFPFATIKLLFGGFEYFLK